MKRGSDIRQLSAPARATAPVLPTLRAVQNACYEALSLALKEGHVFAALTGPEGSGKTIVLEAVLADRRDRALRCIRISDPDKVPSALADHIEQVAYAEASKPENLERHIVLVVDDAHTASPELLTCLSRLAAMREPGRRVPQILLVGRPELWNRLADDGTYEPLARRVAIRATLPAAEDDSDPWAVVENDVTQTMTKLRAEAENLPMVLPPGEPEYETSDHEARGYGRDAAFESEFGFGATGSKEAPAGLSEEEVPPPSVFALFPDPPPAPTRTNGCDSRRRLVMPLVSLFVGLAAFAFALSFYDWPDVFDDLPWSNSKPSTPFVMPRLPQAQSFGLPLPPDTTAASKPGAKMPPLPAAAAVAPPPAPIPAPIPTPIPAPVPPPAPVAVQAPAPTTSAPVAVEPPPPVASPVPVAPPVMAPVAARPVVAEPALPPALIALLLRRGDEQVAIGDISAARLLYERAAESGNAMAARQLARTYDPAFLPPATEGTLADPARAKSWYERAAALGNSDAATRLKTLNQGR